VPCSHPPQSLGACITTPGHCTTDCASSADSDGFRLGITMVRMVYNKVRSQCSFKHDWGDRRTDMGNHVAQPPPSIEGGVDFSTHITLYGRSQSPRWSQYSAYGAGTPPRLAVASCSCLAPRGSSLSSEGLPLERTRAARGVMSM
jgi:hypothetical protein